VPPSLEKGRGRRKEGSAPLLDAPFGEGDKGGEVYVDIRVDK